MTSPATTQTAPAAADQTLEGAVTAVLVTRAATDYLAESLRALLACDPGPARVVVVDASPDSSTDLPFDLTQPDAERVTVVRAPGARSFGAAVKIGRASCRERVF